MKKLITAAVASAFAFLAIGAVNAVDLPSGTSVESYTGALQTTKNDSGSGDDSTYWFLQGDENAELLVTNYVVTPYQPRPEQFTGDNNNYLKIDTTGRLYRSIGVNDQTTTFGNTVDIGDGIYLDTLVQFTAADDQFKDDALAEGDKIAISYVERDAESVDPGEDPYTNIVIRAGYIVDDNETIPTNYFATVPAGFNKEDWHRLTVRAVASIAASGEQKAGFIVYLDGVALEYSTDVECGVDFAPANAVAEYYKADCHAIYPSAVQSGDYQFNLSAVAFNGNGCVDDISFTDQTPGFIGRTVTFDLGTGEAVTTLTVAGTDYDVTGIATTNIENLAENFTIAVTLAENYNISVISNFSGCTYTPTTETSGTVTLTAASATVKVITTRDNFDYTDENGDPQTAVTLTDAFAKVGAGGIISLKFDYNVAAWEGEAFAGFITGNDEYVLDLKGHTLNGGDDGISASLITVYGTLTIKDSVGGGEIIYDTQNGFGIVDNYGDDVLIGAVDDDQGATFTGTLFVDGGEGTVIRGSFDVDNNDNSGSFLWAGYVVATSDTELNQAGDYWVVTPQGAIGTYMVTVTPTANATYAAAYKVGGETITPANDVLTVTVGQTIVITATPAANYEYAEVPTGWAAGQDGEITIEVSAAGTVAIPAPSEKMLGTYTVTVTPTANATYAAAYNDGGAAVDFVNDVAAVTVGKTITITATPGSGYEYAETPAGWTAGQDGEITIEVSAEATVAIPAPTATSTYPSYIDPTDAEETAKYTAWATYAEVSDVATGEVNEEAYLLNCKPSEVAAAKAAFKFTSISYDSTQSKWVTPTTTSYNNRDYNGEVVVKQYSDVGCTTESSTGTFFKAVLQ